MEQQNAVEQPRDPGRLASPRDPALCGSSGTAVVFVAPPETAAPTPTHKELEDPTLRLLTGNSFCFPFRRGVSHGCYWPSTSQPLGLPACQWEPLPNALLVETSAQIEGFVTSEILWWWLRPIVSSDRRIAVEIPAARSSWPAKVSAHAATAGSRSALSSSEGNVLESPAGELRDVFPSPGSPPDDQDALRSARAFWQARFRPRKRVRQNA